MKKIFGVAMAAIVACGLLVGCGGGDAKKDAGKAAAPAQKELPKKIVVGLDDNFPPMGFKDKDNKRHITSAQLNSKFGLHPQTINKLIRQQKLKARIVPSGPIVFLKSDNPNLPDVVSQEMGISK